MRIEDLESPKIYSPRCWISIQRRETMAEAFRRHLPAGTPEASGRVLLDFGCGKMPYKPMLSPHIGRYVGADVPGVKGVDHTIDLATGRVPVEDASADVVLSTQVLEHVPSVTGYLEECRRIAKPGGLLVLSTHGVFKHHPNPNDYWRWTAQGLRKQMEECGWEIVGFEGLVGYSAAAVQLFQDACLDWMPGFLRRPFCLFTQLAVRICDSCYSAEGRRENAVSYLVVARRKG